MINQRINNIVKSQDRRKKDQARFSGLRSIVLSRDKFCCIDCGMSRIDHFIKWRKDLTINHKDGNGRNSRQPNNQLSNLETLCLRCHGKKDGPRWMVAADGMPTLSSVATSH